MSNPNNSTETLLAEVPVGSVLAEEFFINPTLLDLSDFNESLTPQILSSTDTFALYINEEIKKAQGTVGVGGYLEQRGRYADSEIFRQTEQPRSIHLGVDLWADVGTKVFAPIDGVIHSFQDNDNFYDYGPTIIISHKHKETVFHTLYGHLSRESIDELEVGFEISQGQLIGEFGSAEVNGDWPPHLHFQIILDMQEKAGDYPGVASPSDLEFYKQNCPDPNLILRLDVLS